MKLRPGEIPPELAMGPCIEVWADPHEKDRSPSWSAQRRWKTAVDVWAAAVGFPDPRSNARNLARTRLPWSRDYLIRQSRKALVDYYEGNRPNPPKAEERRYDRTDR